MSELDSDFVKPKHIETFSVFVVFSRIFHQHTSIITEITRLKQLFSSFTFINILNPHHIFDYLSPMAMQTLKETARVGRWWSLSSISHALTLHYFLDDVLFMHTISETSDRNSSSVSPSVDHVLISSAVCMCYNLPSSIYFISNPREGDLFSYPSSDQLLSIHRNFTSSRMLYVPLLPTNRYVYGKSQGWKQCDTLSLSRLQTRF